MIINNIFWFWNDIFKDIYININYLLWDNHNNMTIFEIIYQKYLITNWNGFLQNNIEVFLYKKIFIKIDDYFWYKYIYISIYKNIFFFIENLIIIFDKIYFDLLKNFFVKLYWWKKINYNLFNNIYINNIYIDENINNYKLLTLISEKKKLNYGLLYDIKIDNKYVKNIIRNIKTVNFNRKEFQNHNWNTENIIILKKKILNLNNIIIKIIKENNFWLQNRSEMENVTENYIKKNNYWQKLTLFKKNKTSLIEWFLKGYQFTGIPEKQIQNEIRLKNKNFFKYFGGYTYWYMFRYNLHLNEKTYKFLNTMDVEFWRRRITIRWIIYKEYRRIFILNLPSFLVEDIRRDRRWFRRTTGIYKQPFFRWLKIRLRGFWFEKDIIGNEQRLLYKIYPVYNNLQSKYIYSLFKHYIFSMDIWDTKKQWLQKKKINFIENKDIWLKQILIRYPKVKIYNNKSIKIDKIDFLKKMLNKNLTLIFNIDKYLLKINMLYNNKLKIADNNIFLILKSKKYNENLKKWIQSFWIKSFTKNVIYNETKKYFFINLEKKNNKININILNNEYNFLLNQWQKNLYVKINQKNNLFKSDIKKHKIFILKNYYWENYFKSNKFQYINYLKQYDILNKKAAIPENYLTHGTAVLTNNKKLIFFYNESKKLKLLTKLIYNYYFKNTSFYGRHKEYEFVDIVFKYNIWSWCLDFFFINNSISDFIILTNSRAFFKPDWAGLEKVKWVPYLNLDLAKKWFDIALPLEKWWGYQWLTHPWIFYKKGPLWSKSIWYSFEYFNNSLFLEEKNWKKEYLYNIKDIFEYEKKNYKNYFLIKKLEKKIINLKDSFINVLFLYKNSYKIIFVNKYIFWFFISCFFYLIINIFLILLLKSFIPKNNIYGLTSTYKKWFLKKKNIKKKWFFYLDEKHNIKIIRKFLEENDIEEKSKNLFYTNEQRIIYSLENKNSKNWKKKKIYNTYMSFVKTKIINNYNIFYKKLLFEENLEKIFNNKKYIFTLKTWFYFFFFFKNKKKIITFIEVIFKMYNIRFFNWNKNLQDKNTSLLMDFLEIFKKIPDFEISKKIIFIIKLMFGFIFISITLKIQQILNFIPWSRYKKKGYNLRIIRNEKIELLEELNELIKNLKKEKIIEWYKKNIDYIEKINEDNNNIIYSKTIYSKTILNEKTKNNWNLNKEIQINDLISEIIKNLDLKKIENIKNISYIKYLLKLKEKNIKNFTINDILLLKKKNEKENLKLNFELKIINYLIFENLIKYIQEKELKDKLNITIKNLLSLKLENDIDWYIKFKQIQNEIFWKKKWNFEKQINYEILSKFILYRWYSFIGDRIYYYIYLLYMIIKLWWNSIQKIKYNENNIKNIKEIFFFKLKKLIKKSYWEYLLLNKKFNNKINLSIKNILIYSFIFFPIFFLIKFLIVIYLLYIYIYKFYKYIYIYVNKIYNWKKVVYINLKINININELIYKFIYILIGKIEKIWIFLKKKDINNLKKWVILKFQIWKINLIIQWKKKKFVNLNNKIIIIWLLLQYDKVVVEFKKHIYVIVLEIIYIILNKYIILYLEKKVYKLYLDIFNLSFNQYQNKILLNIFWRKEYYKKLWKIIKKKNTNIIILLLIFLKKIILKILMKKWKEKKIKLSKFKDLEDYINNGNISTIIWNQKEKNWIFENMLKEKAKRYNLKIRNSKFEEIEDEDLNINLGINWDNIYKIYIHWKDYWITYWFDIVYDIEQTFNYFTEQFITRKWSPIKRIKLSIKLIWRRENRNKFLSYTQYKKKETSRNIFFYKKWKKKKKIIRKYFLKGILNWISYYFFNRVIFTKIDNLTIKKIKIKKYKKKINTINDNIYITSNLTKVPPQLWALSILYDYYYYGIIFYLLYKEKFVYQKTNEIPTGSKIKWKINPYFGDWDVNTVSWLSYFFFVNDPKNFNRVMQTKPKHVGWRYLIFFLEYVGVEGFSKKKVWTDISLLFGSTYNSKKDRLKFEGKFYKDEPLLSWKAFINWLFFWRPKEEEKIFDDKSKLLKLEFSKIERLKNAFNFKIAFDRMYKDNTINSRIVRKDPDELEKREIFEVNNRTYSEDLGWRSVTAFAKAQWDFENHIIKLTDNYELSKIKNVWIPHQASVSELLERGDPEERKLLKEKDLDHIKHENIKNIKRLLECIGIIYYDITLQEIKLFLMNSNFLKENKSIQTLNIFIKPSIIINLSYEQYKDFADNMEARWLESILIKLFKKYKKLNINQKINITLGKNIKLKKIWSFEDMYLELAHVEKFFLRQRRELIKYINLKHKKDLKLWKEYENEKLIEHLILSIDFIEVWNTIISKRCFVETDKEINIFKENYLNYKWVVKNDKQIKKKKNQLKNGILYLNIVKWNWKQWLHMDLTESEKLKFFNKNTLLLNEKYNIWNLKLMPIRIKIPIQLKISMKEFKSKFEALKGLETEYLMSWSLTNPVTKSYVLLQQFKEYLKTFNQNMADHILIWWLVPDKNDKIAVKLQKKHWKDKRILLRMYRALSPHNLQAWVKMSFDLLLYHAEWSKDEFGGYGAWFFMRYKTMMHNHILSRKFNDEYPTILYQIFMPKSFWLWFYQPIYKYKKLKIFTYLNISWVIFLIAYCPGEFLYNIWLFVIPCWISCYFLFIIFFYKNYINEDIKGKDIYLYKYQASRRKPIIPRGLPWYYYNKKDWENYLVEYGITGKEENWRTNRYSYIKNKFNTVRREDFFSYWIILLWFFHKFWKWDAWRFSNYRGYDYYKKYEEEFASEEGYKPKIWVYENYERLLSGGNGYNIWYINYFRKNKNLKDRKLDYQEGFFSFPPMKVQIIIKKKNPVQLSFDINIADWQYLIISQKYEKFLKLIDLILQSDLKREWIRVLLSSNKKKEEFLSGKSFRKLYIEQMPKSSRFLYENMVRWRTNNNIENLEIMNILLKYEDFYKKETRKEIWRTLKYVVRKRYRNKLKKKEGFNEEVDLILNHKKSDINYKEFLVKSREQTWDLIKNEKMKKNYWYLERKRSFKYERPLDVDILLNISEYEKHINILYYNLIKYKIYRTLLSKTKEQKIKAILIDNLNSYENIKIVYGLEKYALVKEKHFILLHKLNKYILNLSLKDKKLDLLSYFIKQKIINEKFINIFDFYEKMIKFLKIINFWIFDYNFIVFIKNIINLFF